MNTRISKIVLVMFSLLLAIMCLDSGTIAASPLQADSVTNGARLDWWREARFGMFIHWGIYSVPAQGEWYMTNAQVPRSEYGKYAARFDPTKFDADKWAEIAHDAGMKYLVITSKHHDGFSMFKTAATKYNVVDATPWGKDPLKALSAACRRHGIKFCVYYSIMDWHSPFQGADKPDSLHPSYNPTHFNPGEKEKYVGYMKMQLKELVTQYHPAVLWFDGGWMNGWTSKDGVELYQYLRKLDPRLIINNRVIGAGDYETPEQEIPPNGIPGHDWETCMTINDSWGFNSSDSNFKSTSELLHNLIDIASKGGNYLLNVGPTDLGIIPSQEVERLEAMGKWLKANGEAIYGTSAGPFTTQLPWGRCTEKKNNLYLAVFNWPADGKLVFHGLYSKPRTSYLLSDEHKNALKVIQAGDSTVISVPTQSPDRVASVVVLNFSGKPVVFNPPLIESEQDIFIDTVKVVLSSGGEYADVRFTIDGTFPVNSSPLANRPIMLSSTAVITAACFHEGRQVSEVSTKTFTRVSPEPAFAVDSLSPGVSYKYFEGSWEKLPEFSKLVPVREGNMPNFGLPPQRALVNYGATYSGYVKIPEDGVYTFYTASDDGSRLFIDNRLVVDNDQLHGVIQKSGVVPLAAGYHSIKVEFFQASGGDELDVYFRTQGLPMTTIPDSLLFQRR